MDVATLGKIHEDMVYIVECIAQGLGGEAKTELSRLVDYLDELPECEGRGEIRAAVQLALEKMRWDAKGNRDETYCIRLRHRLYNTLEKNRGSEEMYSYADPFDVSGDV
jgi:hypothetical protein